MSTDAPAIARLPILRPEPRALVRKSVWGVILALIVAVAVVALASGLALIELPFQMHLVDQRLPIVFRLHMVASALALLMLPLVIGLRQRPRLHRMLGRVLGVFVLAGGITALPTAILSNSSDVARAGFFVQGLVWMGLFAAGFSAIRARRMAEHARMMLAMAAVTTGAVWFRAVIGTAIALDLPFEPAYAIAAWACWLAPLAVVLRSREPQSLLRTA